MKSNIVTLSLFVFLHLLTQTEGCKTQEPGKSSAENNIPVIILSVSLAVCVVLLLMCGCAIWHLKQKKAVQSKVENIDANPDYGEGADEEQYATAVVDSNDYYD